MKIAFYSPTLGTDQRINFIAFLDKASPILPEALSASSGSNMESFSVSPNGNPYRAILGIRTVEEHYAERIYIVILW